MQIPIVADIHFDYRLALLCAEYGVDKIRINPGNIGGQDRVRAVADACRARHIPIRIGVNSGSLEKHILENTAPRLPRRCARLRCTMRHCSKSLILKISSFLSRLPPSQPRLLPIGRLQPLVRTRSISV